MSDPDPYDQLGRGLDVSFDPTSAVSVRTLDASRLREVVQQGQGLSISNAIVEGVIDLSELTVKRIRLVDCQLGGLNAANCRFEEGVAILGVRGEHVKIDFSSSHFEDKVIVSDCDIRSILMSQASGIEMLQITRCTLSDDLVLKSIHCEGPIQFYRLQINGKLVLRGSMVDGDLSLVRIVCGRFDAAYAHFARVAFICNLKCYKFADISMVEVDKDLRLTFVRFDLVADLQDMRVHGDIELRLAANGNFSMQRTRVDGEINISNSSFAKEADFDGLVTGGDIEVSNVTFGSSLSFNSADLHGSIRTSDCTFKGDLCFDSINVVGSIDLGASDVESDPINVDGEISFILATIQKDLILTGLVVKGDADFHRMKLGRLLLSEGAAFGQSVNIIDAEIGGETRFAKASFGSTFVLRGSTLASLDIDTLRNPDRPSPAEFAGRVDLTACTYTAFYGDGKALLSRQEPFNSQPYTQLESYLRRVGRNDEADDIFYERNRRAAEVEPRTMWSRVVNWLERWFAGYGVRPTVLYVTTLVLPFIFAFLFNQPYALCRATASDCAAVTSSTYTDTLAFAWRVFLPIDLPLAENVRPKDTSCQVQVSTLPVFKPMYVSVRMDYSAAFEKILGWIFVPLSVASFTAALFRRHPGSAPSD